MKRIMFILSGAFDFALDFVNAVVADGGFVSSRAHIRKVLRQLRNADLACPMAAGDDGKLYFLVSFYVQWVRLVFDDGGFVVADAHTKPIIEGFDEASVACPMSAGDDTKLYFRTED